MQKFDKAQYPNLAKLDARVQELLLLDKAKEWSSARAQYEICRIHPVYWMEEYGYVRPGGIELGSDSVGAMPVKFTLNPVQLQIADRICAHFTGSQFTRVQLIILKHRKAGISTLCAAFDYWLMRFYDLHAFCIADLSSHTDNITEMVKLFQKMDKAGAGDSVKSHWPPALVPMPKHKSGMKLSNGAMMEQDTGENDNPGTSGTVNVLHMSENAKWRDPENAETSLLNSVPRTGFVFIVKESTAFGLNKFAQDCEDSEKGKSSWEFCFITWLDMPDCCKDVVEGEVVDLTTEEKEMMAAYKKMTLGHVKFRRDQVDLLGSAERFRQDFPLNSREPFLISGSSFFNSVMVKDRIDTINFYREWKELGLGGLENKYPEIMTRIKSHPRGPSEALSQIESVCVIPWKVELSDNDGAVSYARNPDAKLSNGAALMFRVPAKNHKYIVTVDAGEGKMSSEYVSNNAVVEVFDCFTCEQVCEWAGVFDEEMTASYAVMLAKVYHEAPIVIEMNNKCGGTVLNEVKRTGYTNLYHREYISGNTHKRELGWDTKSGIKKDVCAQFRLDFKNGTCLLHSTALLEEMMFFIDKQGKLEAAPGHLDDRISASTVAIKVISVTPAYRRRDDDRPPLTETLGSYVAPSVRPAKRETIQKYM